MIPKLYSDNCKEQDKVIECKYIIHKDCPNTCKYSKEISGVYQSQTSVPTKTGLEKFIAKYGRNWRMVAFSEIPGEINGY